MIAQPEPAKKTTLLAALGMVGVFLGLSMVVNLLLSMPVQGKTIDALTAISHQQPIIINGRSVYAVPIVTGPTATAILQGVPATAIAYVVHTFDDRGKVVATALSWFRCADIVSDNQYNGNQTEIETWTLLTDQERLEVQAACTL